MGGTVSKDNHDRTTRPSPMSRYHSRKFDPKARQMIGRSMSSSSSSPSRLSSLQRKAKYTAAAAAVSIHQINLWNSSVEISNNVLRITKLFVNQSFLEYLLEETKAALLHDGEEEEVEEEEQENEYGEDKAKETVQKEMEQNNTPTSATKRYSQQKPKQQQQGQKFSIVFFECSFNLESPTALSALAELISLYNVTGVELWDGELSIAPTTLSSLLDVLSKEATLLERLRLDNVSLTTTSVGTKLAELVKACSYLSHFELVGCFLDLDIMDCLSQTMQDGHAQYLTQVIVQSCPIDNLLLTLLLRGLVSCPLLQHVQLTGNRFMTPTSLLALTLFVRQCPTLQELYIPQNPNLFDNCTIQQVQPFFDELVLLLLRSKSKETNRPRRHFSSKTTMTTTKTRTRGQHYFTTEQRQQEEQGHDKKQELFLCNTGLDETAVNCLFHSLERNTTTTTIERLDLRDNDFPLSIPWLSSLRRCNTLQALYLPSSIPFTNLDFIHAMQHNTSIITCPTPPNSSWTIMTPPTSSSLVSSSGSSSSLAMKWGAPKERVMDSSSLNVCNINHILNDNKNHNSNSNNSNNNNNSDLSVVWNIPRILHRNKLLQFVNQKLLINDGCGYCYYSDLVAKNKNNKNSRRRNTSQRIRTTILNERMKRSKPLPTTTTTRQHIPRTTTGFIPLSLWPHILEQIDQKKQNILIDYSFFHYSWQVP